ncbi:uncharacterized protein LOC133659881 [Entelurus aequoreus]|uniref:uncharacterized protein LOC133659881 n=1 Tax=Entelurus aequoreus TaxID=161455 RepID=UPI002B1D64F0|nr:uncharacterized protein LOC133659881 [Entelurus aequoreus]XP_061918806.1 uncharacterized protein LOC133659881 [Entelurus aequoreus]
MSGGKDDVQPQGGENVDPEKENVQYFGKGKRAITYTAKGLEMKVDNYHKAIGACVKKAAKIMDTMKQLMHSNENDENANAVRGHLEELIHLCGEARENHSSLIALPLPEEELDRKNDWFQEKIKILEGFIKLVHEWLSEVKKLTTHDTAPVEEESQLHVSETHGSVETQVQDEMHVPLAHDEHLCITLSDIGAQDSASNVSVTRSSITSTTSSTSSARIRAQAEKAALMAEAAALEKKHQIELQQRIQQEQFAKQQEQFAKQQEQFTKQQEQLRMEKEKLEMETKLAAANAREHVFATMGSMEGSRLSRMSSESHKVAAAPKKTMPLSDTQVGKPKQFIYEKYTEAHYMTPRQAAHSLMQADNLSKSTVQMKKEDVKGHTVHTTSPVTNAIKQDHILDLLKSTT